MTKHGGNVHAPVTLTVYTEDTGSNNEFVELTMKITENKKEREDVYVLGIWILAFAAIVLDRVDYILLLGCEPLVRLERQARDDLRAL